MDRPYRFFILEDEIDRYPRNQIAEVLKQHGLTITRSCDQAIERYVGGYDLLLLDHDMEGFFEDPNHPNTGYQFVKWLTSHEWKGSKPQVMIHSHNPDGRKVMRLLLEEHGYHVTEMPFGAAYVRWLKETFA